MAKYRNRITGEEFEAEQYHSVDDELLLGGFGVVNAGDKETVVHVGASVVGRKVPAGCGLIATPSGFKVVSPRDWIATNGEGYKWAIKARAFEVLYELAG